MVLGQERHPELMYPHENAQISRVMFRELREISYFKQKIKKEPFGLRSSAATSRSLKACAHRLRDSASALPQPERSKEYEIILYKFVGIHQILNVAKDLHDWPVPLSGDPLLRSGSDVSPRKCTNFTSYV